MPVGGRTGTYHGWAMLVGGGTGAGRGVAQGIRGDAVAEGGGADRPAGDGFEASPAAGTVAFEDHVAAERGAGVPEGEYGPSAAGAGVAEQLRMLQGAPYEGSEPHGIRGHLHRPAAAVVHLQPKWDKVEPVNVLPVIEPGVDLAAVAVEQFCVGQLPGGGTRRALPEKIVLFHSTILFLIEQSASLCHRGFGLLGWRPIKGRS